MTRPVFACVWLRAVERRLLALVLALALPGACAETAIKGTVRDRVTDAPLPGVEVEVRRGGDVLGRAISNTGDGSFLVTVEVGNQPQAVNLKLLIRRRGYQSADEDVVVVSPRPRPPAMSVALLRSDLADCLRKTSPRWVVVGHFRPPLGLPDTGGFSQGVFDAVRWELSKIADTSSVVPDRRPVVVNCRDIDERDFLSAAARELRADALLLGVVSRPPDGARFTVRMFVGDQHGLFAARTAPILSRDVDLEDPSASRLDAMAAGAIVQALLTGYLKDGRFEECVEFSRRAGTEIRPLPMEIARINAECMRKLPTNGLRGGAR
jgi:hypothetical protein